MAGAAMMWNDYDFKNNILRWALLCVLTEDCIAPQQIQKTCTPPSTHIYKQEKWPDMYYLKNMTAEVAESLHSRIRYCSRFDQALMSILIENHYNYNTTKFFLVPGKQLAKPFRTGAQGSVNNEKLGSADATHLLNEIRKYELERRSS